ncbi:hypothetical protein BDFB_001972 [Asbolus verrucosus]|uniref:Uncharacterized protein n=1 Tax=Asbolus verrucosus TaxID=1661398 RepID=A0A482W1J8_ASBVE|nr:hypothetical protein BDFB_001972 [Asbolus verrucosus]
MLATKLVN